MSLLHAPPVTAADDGPEQPSAAMAATGCSLSAGSSARPWTAIPVVLVGYSGFLKVRQLGSKDECTKRLGL